MNNLFLFDADFKCKNLIGVDEAGRGPLAGPVVAAAVILDISSFEFLKDVNDSKKLSPKKRKELFPMIKEKASDFALGFAGHEEIDEINIHNASLLAMKRAVENLKISGDYILIDGRFPIPQIDSAKQKAVIKGDSKSACIAAASILAKVTRDELMEEFHKNYPEYNFAKHKGYPTALHIELLKKNGPSPIHRTTFCKNFINYSPLFAPSRPHPNPLPRVVGEKWAGIREIS